MVLDMRNKNDRDQARRLRVRHWDGDVIDTAFAFDTVEGYVLRYVREDGKRTLKVEADPEKPGERRPVIERLCIDFQVYSVATGEVVAWFKRITPSEVRP